MSARQAIAPSPEANIKRAYVICTMTRTGSSLLCDTLGKIGIAGKPAEYFDIHQRNRSFWERYLKIEDPSQYLEKVLAEGTTPNGVFGLKLHGHQTPALISEFGADPKSMDIDRCLATRFPIRKYLWLRRRNKIAQAISYYRASKSRVWRVGPGVPEKTEPPPAVAFDADQIDHYVTLVEQFDRQWDTWFRVSRQRGMVLVYEDFCQQYEQTIRAVCGYIGVGGSGFQVPPPRFQQQADEMSAEWEARYRSLRGLPADGGTAPLKRTPQAAILAGPPPRRASPELAPAETSQDTQDATRIIAYDLGTGQNVPLVAGPNRRGWMDATPYRYAYRCLPMVIANQHGWMMLAPHRIEAIWDGGQEAGSILVREADGVASRVATSHFGSGILTFSANYLFRTPPGVNLHVRGPANLPKDGISALEGIVETDWSQATFTMNWMFTRANHPVVFEKGEPFAMFSPVRRGDIERFEPEMLPLGADPALEAGYKAWSASRNSFNKDLKVADSDARKAGWQRHYTRGETLMKDRATSHQTKLFVNEFERRRKTAINSD
jgi:LPS sulfotransferase NodH